MKENGVLPMTNLSKIFCFAALAAGLLACELAEAANPVVCVKRNGAMRLAPPTNTCKRRERAIQLLENTPEGLAGAAGLQGPKGDPGPQGLQGLRGEAGNAGSGNPKVFDNNGISIGYLADPTVLTVYVPSVELTARIEADPTSPNYGNVALVKEDTTRLYTGRTNAQTCAGAEIYPVQYQYAQIVRQTDARHYLAKAKTGISPSTVYAQGFNMSTNPPTPECREVNNVIAAPKPTYVLTEIPQGNSPNPDKGLLPSGPPFTAPVAFPVRTQQQ
jgi:hypothetical protein